MYTLNVYKIQIVKQSQFIRSKLIKKVKNNERSYIWSENTFVSRKLIIAAYIDEIYITKTKGKHNQSLFIRESISLVDGHKLERTRRMNDP